MSGDLLRSRIFVAGVFLFIAGTLPFLLYLLLSLIPLHVLWLIFFVSFWPSVLLMAAGTAIALRRASRRKRQSSNA